MAGIKPERGIIYHPFARSLSYSSYRAHNSGWGRPQESRGRDVYSQETSYGKIA